MADLPIKPLSDIDVKSEVSESDKILILDSDTNEARLASKEELKGDKGDQWEQGEQWEQWEQGVQWNPWPAWASIVSASFSWDDIVFWKDDSSNVTLANAKTTLTWPQGEQGEQWEQGVQWPTWNGIASITSSKVWKTTTVTITETNGTVDTFQVQDWADGGGGGSGDMIKSTYDPNGIEADAFDYNNFLNTPTVNTRQFILPSLSSLTVAQQIYEYALWGDGAVIRYNNEDYFLSWFDNGDPIFLRTKIESATSNDWTNTYMKDTGLKFTIVSANVTAISVVNNTNPWYLATGVNYATPYTPEYNGSPATKKYVDDGLSSKQDTISDLSTIRSWASAWATAVQPWDLGTAATKDTWTSAWNVPVLDANGKLETSIVPSMTTSLSALTDVTIASPTNWQVVSYNSTSQKWENTTFQWGAIQYNTNSPYKPGYFRVGTQAQYDALSQYYTVQENDTIFMTV